MATEVLEQLDLAQGALGQNLLAKNICDLLDGDALVGLVVDGGTERRGYRQQLRRGRKTRQKSFRVAAAAQRIRIQCVCHEQTGCVKLTRRYRKLPDQAPW